MNTITAGLRFGQRLNLLVLLSALAVFGVAILQAAPPSIELSETVPLPIGNVEIVEDPSGAKKDAYLIMEHLYVAQVAGDEAIQFHVNERTRIDQDLKVGDKVEVLAAQNGEALSIKKTE